VSPLAGIVASAGLVAVAARIASPSHWVVWVMLVPWLASLDGAPTLRVSLASGVAMAGAFSVVVFHWFPPAIADYAGVSVAFAAAAMLVATPLFQPAFVVFPVARWTARRRGLGAAASAVAGAAAWVATEWAIPKLFGDSLGIGLFPSRLLRQGADVAGLGGLTFAVVVGNECAWRVVDAAWRRDGRRAVGAAASLAAIVGALATYGAVRLAAVASAPAAPPLVVGVVQANVAHYDRLAAEVGTYEAVRRILDAHFAGSDDALARGPLDLLVWPETVYPTTFGAPKSDDGAAFDRAIGGLVARTRRPLVFGSYDAEGGQEYNAAVLLEPAADGRVDFDAYRKASLFPLTERVPAWLDGPRLRAWLPWLGTWTPGGGPATLDLTLADGRRVRLAPLICYDAVDPRNVARAVRAGAELVVTLSNDSWLAGDGARLHFLVSAFRSIETRRPQVRATPTGISGVIDATGEVVAAAPPGERGIVVASVRPLAGPTTLAVALGDWLGPVSLALACALLGPWRLRRARC
jgi:apolipoprotein N-acyltransferase